MHLRFALRALGRDCGRRCRDSSGNLDRLIPLEHARRYAARITGAAYAEVAGCGHAMYFEKPAEFASAVTRFLSTHPQGAAESGVSR